MDEQHKGVAPVPALLRVIREAEGDGTQLHPVAVAAAAASGPRAAVVRLARGARPVAAAWRALAVLRLLRSVLCTRGAPSLPRGSMLCTKCMCKVRHLQAACD